MLIGLLVGVCLTGIYTVAWNWWPPRGNGWDCKVAFALAPISVPVGALLLLTVYRH